jgi:hypothetical protein
MLLAFVDGKPVIALCVATRVKSKGLLFEEALYAFCPAEKSTPVSAFSGGVKQFPNAHSS